MYALPIISAIVGTVSTVSSAMFQAQVAKNNAVVAENNANRSVQEAAVAAQEGDQAANADLGQMLAQAGASGLTLNTGSMGLKYKSASELAARDRGYTIYKGASEAAGYRQQANDFRTEAGGARSSAMFGLVGGALDVGGSLISRKTKVNNDTARKITGGIY